MVGHMPVLAAPEEVLVTRHALERWDQRIGEGSLHRALDEGVTLPDWLGAIVFRRGVMEPARFRVSFDPPAALVLLPDPLRVVSVYRPRRAQLVAVRRFLGRPGLAGTLQRRSA